MSTALCVAWYATLALAYSVPAGAQDRSIREVLSFLVTNQAVPTADVIKDREAAEATRDTIARALLVELATLPVVTSSSAFTYRFNPALGTLDRLAQSFGALLIDRAVTTGRRQASVGVTYRYASFTTLDGRDLRDGSLVTTANHFRDEPTPFDLEALTLRASATTITVFGNVGVTDWVDVGIAVPVVRFDLAGERINTYRGATVPQARATASATGVADVALRAKTQVIGEGVSGLATGLEVRLPTGNPDNMNGTGRTSVKGLLIGSYGRGPVDLHINASWTGGGVSREVGVGAAVAVAASPRFTLSAETLVRRVKELAEIREVVVGHPLVVGVDTIRLSPVGGNGVTALVVGGLRWNVARTWLVNAHLMVPATQRGLRARPSPAVSIDYSFGP